MPSIIGWLIFGLSAFLAWFKKYLRTIQQKRSRPSPLSLKARLLSMIRDSYSESDKWVLSKRFVFLYDKFHKINLSLW